MRIAKARVPPLTRTDVVTTVIFDLDGTLLDSAPGIVASLTFAIRKLGHDFYPPADIRTLIGPPMNVLVAQLLRPFGDDRVVQCVELYREHYRRQGLYDCTPYLGVAEALERLAANGYSLFVATSKRQEFAEHMLRHTGLYNRFAKVLGTSADGSLDDKADLLESLMSSLDGAPSQAIMIGDKRDDMIAARKNHLTPIGVRWGYGSDSELTDSGAEVLVDSPNELSQLVANLISEKRRDESVTDVFCNRPNGGIRLIATDLDGTLLRSDGTISDRTCRAVQQAQRAGMHFVLVTARPPRSIRWIAQRLGVSGLAVCSNGAITYDLANDSFLTHHQLATGLVMTLASRLREQDSQFRFATEHGHKIGYEPGYPQNSADVHIEPPLIAPLSALCADPVTKLNVYHPDIPVEDMLRQITSQVGSAATATHSGGGFVEIIAAGLSKATALDNLCQTLRVNRQHVIAFGDMPNDVPMLSFAGHSVAVSNAHPAVLNAANEITASNDNDGVALVIEKRLREFVHPAEA
jgi:phosphoglycolate phosphatase